MKLSGACRGMFDVAYAVLLGLTGTIEEKFSGRGSNLHFYFDFNMLHNTAI